MANQFKVKNGLVSDGDVIVSGSITATGGINISGSIASAETASFAPSYTLTSSFNSYTSSASSSVGLLSSSIATTTLNLSSSIGSLSGSITTTTSNLSSSIGSLSSSVATTTLNLSSSVSSSIGSLSGSIDTTTSGLASRIGSVETKTGSYATTGSNIFVGSQVITGSLYITTDLVVQGCSCLQNITASAVSIGTNTVILNTATPAVRFAGISVQDSGSNAGVTGSIFWDGLCNKWVYSNPSGIGYSGGMLLSGPRTSTLGSETPLTCNYIAKSGGGDHLYDSIISESGSSISIAGTISSTDGAGNIVTIANNHLRSNTAAFYFDACAVAANFNFRTSTTSALDTTAMFICGANGYVGIGSTTPTRKLTISGNGSQAASTGASIRLDNTTSGRPTIIDFDDNENLNVIASTDTGNIRFITGTGSGSEKIRITSSGIVGIGLTNPSCYYSNQLVVSAGSEGGITIANPATTGAQYIMFADGTSGADRYRGYMSYNHTDNSMSFATDANTRLIINNSGISCFGGRICAPSLSIIGDSIFCSAGSTSISLEGTTPVLNLTRNNNASSPAAQINFKTSQGTVRWQIATNSAAGTGLEINQGDSTNNRFYIDVNGLSCFGGTVCMSNAIFSTAGTATLVNTNITSTACFGATSRAGFTGIADNCNGVYFGMGADGTGISAGLGFFREATGWNSALTFYTNCVTDGVTVPRIQEKMRITSSGLVGIGCSSPTYHLEVRCAASTSCCYLAAMFSRSTGANDGNGDIVAFGANGVSSIAGMYRSSAGGWGLELQTANQNTRMRIDNSGITTFCCQVCGPKFIATHLSATCLTLNGFSSGNGFKMDYGSASGEITAVNLIANGTTNGFIGIQMVDGSNGDLWLGGSSNRSMTIYRTGNHGFNITTPCTKVHVEGGYGSKFGCNGCFYGGGYAGGQFPYGDQYGNGAAYTYQTCYCTTTGNGLYGGYAAGYFRGGDGGSYGGGGAGIVAIGGNGANSESVNSGGGAGIFVRGGLNGSGSVHSYAGWFDGGDVIIRCGNLGVGSKCTPNAPLDVTSASSSSSTIQQWSYNTSPNSYRLQLNTLVCTGLVRYSFDMLNAGASYNCLLTFDRGNVGIGASCSNIRLYVNQPSAQGTSTPALRVSYIGAGDGNSQNVAMFTNDATLATSGYLYIGSYSGSDWYIGKNVAGSSANYNFQLGTATNNILGTLTTGGAWSTTGGGTSDRRVKKDITPISQNALSFINELNPVSFKFKEDAAQKTRRGFIAQDILNTSIPDLVLGDGELEGGTYGLDYDGILSLAVKAIQEQQCKITLLESCLGIN